MKAIELSDNLGKRTQNRSNFIVSNRVYNILEELSLIGGFARFNLSLEGDSKQKKSNYHSLVEWLELFAFPSVSEHTLHNIIRTGYYN